MDQNSSLILLHVIFRHGDRTPVKEHTYPKGEHLNEDYYPYGHGQLTQEGKKAMYDLGEVLHGKYSTYLGDIYVPCKVDALATELDRTQMSLQLVLAALFPPKTSQILKKNLNWQPIPYKCLPYDDDKIFAGPTDQEFIKVYRENYKKTSMKQYEDFFNYFEEHTGIKNPTSREVWVTLGTIMTEMEWGFTMESWIPPVFNKIKEVGLLEYQMQTATNELKRLVAGDLFLKILNDSKAKIDEKSTCDVHLYSGHDYNVAHTLIILGLMYPHFPRYAACILLELHKQQEDCYFKVIYRDSKHSEFQTMTFPDGKDTLSFDEFERIVAKFTQVSGRL